MCGVCVWKTKIIIFIINFSRCNLCFSPLSAFAKNFYHAPAVADAVKRLSGLDAAVVDLVQLGCLQQLRRLLREALVYNIYIYINQIRCSQNIRYFFSLNSVFLKYIKKMFDLILC